MVIFHSYVSLLEDNGDSQKSGDQMGTKLASTWQNIDRQISGCHVEHRGKDGTVAQKVGDDGQDATCVSLKISANRLTSNVMVTIWLFNIAIENPL